MEVKRIVAAYWSATGNTDKTVNTIADALAAALAVPLERRSFTRPAERETDLVFAPGDLVVFGMPTYAGKLPNKIMPSYRALLQGQDTPAVAIVTFGNRSFDNSLAELRDTAESGHLSLLMTTTGTAAEMARLVSRTAAASALPATAPAMER